MSDKSFGDYSNRNNVKNPLLSNAVTGLSIEDLTHNTFLLPAVRNQGLISSQDAMQNAVESNIEKTVFESGDTNSNIPLPVNSNKSYSPITATLQTVPLTHNNNTNLTPKVSSTEASVKTKTDDDFDVNEYFARLQGTRYVSAPKNCPLTEDQNANLQATEESLEEINLNDSQGSNETQSITADIAQNFSQLPQVLPQVASAVFSSFSNMLSLKSREQTPDYDSNKGTFSDAGFHEVQFESGAKEFETIPEIGVSPLNATESNITAPPPKEPPRFASTSTTYRMAAKKKTYAPIPGLSSGDVHAANIQAPTFQMTKPEIPSFLDPTLHNYNTTEIKPELTPNLTDNSTIISEQNQYSQKTVTETKHELNISSSINNLLSSIDQTKTYQPTPFNTELNSAPNSQETVLSSITENQQTGQIIPPPPMFSNIPVRTDVNTPPISRSILPPSVARRISSNQQTQVSTPSVPNFFVPQIPSESSDQETINKDVNINQFAIGAPQMPPTSFSQKVFERNIENIQRQPELMKPTPSHVEHFNVIETPKERVDSSTMESPNNSNEISNQNIIVTKLSEYTPNEVPMIATVKQAPKLLTEVSKSYEVLNTTLNPVVPPSLFNPIALETKFEEKPHEIISPVTHPPPPEPPKILTEPPKLPSNQSYRLTKKKPQYYAGPIEGIGSVGNNFKPVLLAHEQPLLSNCSYQGSLFTPVQSTIPESTPLYSASESFPSTQAPIDSGAILDIIKPVVKEDINIQSYTPIDLTSTTSNQNQSNYGYSTAFDTSRITTDSYEQNLLKQESPSQGLLGSLKSKLGAIDINKIQNTVTTFFDPGYNVKGVEQQNIAPNNQYPQETNLEIYVPIVDQQNIYAQQQNFPGNPNYSIGTQQYQSHYLTSLGDPQTNSPVVANVNIQHTESPLLYNYANPTQSFVTPNQTYEPQTNLFTRASERNVNLLDKNKTSAVLTNSNTQNREAQSLYNYTNTTQPTVTQSKENEGKEIENPIYTNVSNQDTLEKTNIEPSKVQFVQNADSNVINKNESSDVYFSKPDVQHTTEASYKRDTVASNTSLFTKPTFYAEDQARDQPLTVDNTFEKSAASFFDTTSLSTQPDSNVNINEQLPTYTLFGNSGLKCSHENQEKDIQDISNTKVENKNTLTEDFLLSNEPAVNNNSKETLGSNVDREKSNNKSSESPYADPFYMNQPYAYSHSSSIPPNNPLLSPKMDHINLNQNLFYDNPNIVETQDMKNKIEDISQQKDINNVFTEQGDEKQREKNFRDNNCIYHLKETEKQSNIQQLDDTLYDKDCFDVYDNSEIIKSESIKNDDMTNENLEMVPDKDNELNICDTCREVNKPEEKDSIDDLTNHLIKNITAPIQLQNPVEVPLPDADSVPQIPPNFDIIDVDEVKNLDSDPTMIDKNMISFTLECSTFTVDGSSLSVNHTWTAENAPLDESSNIILDDINAYINANPDPLLGYFGEESYYYKCKQHIPTNASDEIKAEYRVTTDPKSVSQNVPPASNLAGMDDLNILDVQEIEQDAKKDFPIYDDYVIEPSETDDNKIECREQRQSSEDESEEVESFTNRVDKFKKLKETSKDLRSSNNICEQDYHIYERKNTDIPIYKDFLSKSSQVEYLTSYLESTNYGDVKKFCNETESSVRTLPDTVQPKNDPLSNITKAMGLAFSEYHKNHKTQISSENVVSGIFNTGISALGTDEQSAKDIKQKSQDEPIKETLCSNEPFTLFGNSKNAEESTNKSVLQDPMNFFSSNNFTSNQTKTTESVEAEAGYNRLASYFTSPPKNDNTKSFFELSQSQNHYRQNSDTKNPLTLNTNQNISATNSTECKQMSTRSFFELGQSQNHYKDKSLDTLMKDLTSLENYTPNKKDVNKTVNYFFVEYDNKNVLNNIKTDHKKTENVDKSKTEEKSVVDEEFITEETLTENKDLLKQCNYYCNKFANSYKTVGGFAKENYKIRKAMDAEANNTGSNKNDSTIIPDVHTGGINRRGINVNINEALSEVEEGMLETDENRGSTEYTPVKHHWFYRVDTDGKSAWIGFSTGDSRALEEAFSNSDLNENTVIATDGGRFDVNVIGRLRVPVYWSEKPTNVRRCSWFYKSSDVGYVPYTEAVADLLEEEYRNGIQTGVWHRRITLPNNEAVVMHSPSVMVHFPPYSADTWSGGAFRKTVRRNPPKVRFAQDQTRKIDHLVFIVHGAGEWKNQKKKNQAALRPLMVARGYDDAIQDEQPTHIDHLLMFCHGVGPFCDMSFRSVEQVVNDFRSTSLKLTQSHYKNSYDSGTIGRVEMLPISWHSTLHSGEHGVDSRLAQITLESIPKLRSFTNDTILDVLFYTSPTYCQTIVDAVCKELNRIYALFKARNPNFNGGISLAGHSLGSVILYDILCNQNHSTNCSGSQKKYVQNSTCAIQPNIKYPHLDFTPDSLYALGSPIAIFEFIRGVESLGDKFCLPTCSSFFNIFHPYDPIAYRVEPLINTELKSIQPYLIPHHKGRKRMHLELKDTMARVSADIKQKLIEVVKASWYSMWRTQPPSTQQLEKVVEEEIENEKQMECKENVPQENDPVNEKMLGQLNRGRRIDYVLQEAPIEMINEYIFAIRSHVCYWESEDVMLLMLREIYLSLGVQPDSCVPQQSMTVERTRTASGGEEQSTTISTISEIPTTSRNVD